MESTMQILTALVREVAAESGVDVIVMYVLLLFSKPGYMLGGFVPAVRVADYENGYTGEKRPQLVCPTEMFGAPIKYRNSNVLVANGGEQDVGPWVAKLLLLFE